VKKPKRRVMRERISILSRTTLKDDFGQSVPVCESIILSNVPAHFEHVGGGETFRGRQVEADVAGVFEMRAPSVRVTPKMFVRALDQNNYTRGEDATYLEYEIVSIRPSDNGYGGADQWVWVFVRGLASV
jgi:hypothetical protein